MKTARIMPSAMVLYGEKVIFPELCGNTYYSLDVETGEAQLIEQLDSEPFAKKDLFSDVVLGDDLLFFIPHNSLNLIIYDVKKKNSFYKPLPKELNTCSGIFKTAIYDAKRTELILPGYCISQVFVYSYSDNNFYELEVPIKHSLYTSGIAYDNEVILVSKESPEIYVISRNNNEIKTLKPEGYEKGYIDIFKCDEGVIAVSCDTHKMYRIDNGEIRLFAEGFKADFDLWPQMGGSIGDDGKYYFSSDGKICIFNPCTREFQYVDIGELSLTKAGAGRPLFVGQSVVIWFYETSKVVKYDRKTGDIHLFDIWTKDFPSFRFDEKGGEIIYETEFRNIEGYLEALGRKQ